MDLPRLRPPSRLPSSINSRQATVNGPASCAFPMGITARPSGALSVGSMDQFARLYQPMMMDNIHVKAPDCYRCLFIRRGKTARETASSTRRNPLPNLPKETCALIVEPLLQGCAGMRVYPAVYLKNCGRCAMPIMCFLSVMKLPRDLAGRKTICL